MTLYSVDLGRRDHCPGPHLKPKHSFLQSRPQEVSHETREVQWANLMTNSLPQGHFFPERACRLGKGVPHLQPLVLSSSQKPPLSCLPVS